LYQIKKDPDSRKLVVHVDHLKPYSGEHIPVSWKVDENVLAFPNSTTFDLLFVDTISTQSHLRQRNEASHLDYKKNFDAKQLFVDFGWKFHKLY
jgi:hypothetical protein